MGHSPSTEVPHHPSFPWRELCCASLAASLGDAVIHPIRHHEYARLQLTTLEMIPQQPYAPTPHSYVPNSTLSATINLDEVRLGAAMPRMHLQSAD